MPVKPDGTLTPMLPAVSHEKEAQRMAITYREGLPTRGQEALMTWAVILLPVTWVICLARSGAYAPRYIGTGPDEYRTVSQAVVLLAVAAVLSYAFKLEVSRGFVGLVVPLVLLLTFLGRYVLRTRLFHQRARGEMLQKTVVVGRADSAADLVRRIRQHPETTGLDVVGVCLSEMVSTWVSLRKTIVDRIMGAAVLALLAPVLVVLVIRLESKGPALFKQVRIIDGGRPFRMFKFR
jgi:FlaA1/EpsC-like NDP-sugar epimerase